MSDILSAIVQCFEIGPEEALRRHEAERGFSPIRPGDAPWFPAEDWHERGICSIDNNRVRIVAVIAQRPRTGSFMRMVDAIIGHGLIPVVVEPLDVMETIMQRWGWYRKEVAGNFFEREVSFEPPAEWLADRIARAK